MQKYDNNNYSKITLLEEVESKEIGIKYNIARFIRCIISIILTIIVYNRISNDEYIYNLKIEEKLGYLLIPIGVFLVAFGFCTLFTKEYKKLYKLALHNDMVRHDERIRFKERQRLMLEHSKKKIKKANQLNKKYEEEYNDEEN